MLGYSSGFSNEDLFPEPTTQTCRAQKNNIEKNTYISKSAITYNNESQQHNDNHTAFCGKKKNSSLRHFHFEQQPSQTPFTGLTLADERRLLSAFVSRKRLILAEIARHSAPDSDDPDKSPKGYIDEKCLPIMNLLNNHEDYVTTSSCSGRIALFHDVYSCHNARDDNGQREDENEDKEKIQIADKVNKKRGTSDSLGWIVVSHDYPLLEKEVQAIIDHTVVNGSKVPLVGSVTFKVESFLLHVQSRTMQAAKFLLTTALDAGFRNSGVILPGKNIIVALRLSGLGMDVPLTCEGRSLGCDESYVRNLVKIAGEKMARNEEKINGFYKALEKVLKGEKIKS